MKIGFHGLPLPEGKIRYNDSRLLALKEKLQPDKFSPFFAEFIQGEMVHCDGIIIHRENLLDLSVYNMQEARKKNLVKLVDRDCTIEDGSVIEIRFNV
jgi:hypothetical protein